MFWRRKKVARELYEFPERAKQTIRESVVARAAPCFHGGCVGCVVRIERMNLTIEGLRYCSGCRYFNAEWELPDKAVCIDLPAGGNSASSIDRLLGIDS